MKFIKTAVASITLYAISGSVFATTYFSMQDKSDAIQHVRDEANAAHSLYQLSIEKFNLDRANYTQEDQAISDKALNIIRNAGARIAEIQHAVVMPVSKPAQTTTPKYNNSSLTGPHLDSNVTDAQRITAILEHAPKPVNGVEGKKGAKGDKGKDGTTTTVTRIQVDAATQTKVANNSQAISATAQDLQTTRQSLQAMNNNANQQFKSLRDEVDNNKKQANAGISGAMAMAGLPQVQTDQRVMFSAGGATYQGESALAVGASVNFNSHVIGKVSFSDDTANNMGASVGVGMGF